MSLAEDNLTKFAKLPDHLLAWYETAARDLPWRVGPQHRALGRRPDPYQVWLAEIMLQQTTIPHGTRYWHHFVRTWPTIENLAVAKDEDVMAAWAGLGYYARARNLLKCAREIAARGGWPETAAELRKLPGIGPYTAGAIAALAFDRQEAAVDGNVERVFSRLLATEGEWAEEKARIRDLVSDLVPADRPAEFAEALMDLGATLCTPKRPDCLICPLRELCLARQEGAPERYPIKPKKTPKPTRLGHVFVLVDGDRNVLTERRPDRGLLGGMLGLPTSDWGAELAPLRYPAEADWQEIGEVRHVFTHFALTLKVWRADAEITGASTPIGEAADSLPSVFAKALKLAVGGLKPG